MSASLHHHAPPGRYRFVRTLGSGRFGEVVCAEQVGPAGFRRLVALKRSHADDPRSVSRLLREARIGGLLHHENIVATHDVGRDEVGWYLVLEYVDGVNLAAILESHRAAARLVPLDAALDLALQLASGLEHAQLARSDDGRPLALVHGDLSPANVLLSRGGKLKIADFGAARSALDGADLPPPRGTLGYAAPELAAGEPLDARADVYAAGAVLRNLFALADPRVPALDELVRSATAPDPRDRLPDAAALASALRAIRVEHPRDRAASGLGALVGGWVDALGTLASEGADLASPPVLPARPYRGLESFGAESAALFFGRQDDARRLAERIRQQPLVVLTGASGAGKSSLIAAGLAPHLPELLMHRCRPGRDPVASLARCLGVPEEAVASPHGVPPLGAPALVVVDQAEELSTLAPPARRDAAVRALVRLSESGEARVLFSVRADFLAALCDLEPLRAGAVRSVELLALPSREQLTDALTRPLPPFGCRFESPALVDRIVTSLAGQPGSLALLQFCADRLWDARDRQAGVLREADYDAMGGVEGALATYADSVLAEMAPHEQDIARRILLRTMQGGTRRPVEVAALLRASWAGERAPAVLERLVAARLLTRRLEPDTGPVVEPAHEALAAHWRRLDLWVAQDVAARRLLDELVEAAARWERADRSPDLLWRGDLLAQWRRHATDLAEHVTPPERAFADASLRHERRRRRTLTGATVGSMAVLLALAVLALAGWRNAQHAHEEADRSRLRTEVDAVLTRSAFYRERGDTGRAVQLARQVLVADPTSTRAASELYAAVGGRDERAILTGHEGTVRDGAFSPDGSHVVTVGMDGTARIWDRSGMPLRVVRAEGAPMYLVRLHPSGERFVTVSGDGLARVLDLAGRTVQALRVGDHAGWAAYDATGERLLVTARDGSAALFDGAGRRVADLPGHTRTVLWGAFSPDGELAATVGMDGEARIWTRDGVLVRTHTGLGDAVWVDFSRDGSLLVASWPGAVRVYAPDGAERAVVRGLSRYTVAAWHPDGRRFAAGSPHDANAVVVMDADGHPLHTLSGHRAPVFTVVFSPRGDRLASASEDGEIRVFDDQGELVAVLAGHERRVWAIAWSPDGEELLSVSEDGTARLWGADGRAATRIATGEPVDHCELDPSGERVVTLAVDDEARSSVLGLYGRDGGRLGRWTARDGETVTAARFSPDGRQIALLRADGIVDRRGSGGDMLTPLRDRAPVRSLAFEAEGSLLTGAEDGQIVRWSPDGAPVSRIASGVGAVRVLSAGPDGRGAAAGPEGAVSFDRMGRTTALPGAAKVIALCWSPDGTRLAAGGRSGAAWLWDDAGRLIAPLQGHLERTVGCAFHPSSGRLATASWDGTARIWSRDGELIDVVTGHTREVQVAGWSPDGERFLTESWDGTAVLRNDRGVLATLSGHGGEVVRASWSKGGRLLGTCARGGRQVRLWPGDAQELLRWARALVPEAPEDSWLR